jgi:hypothetical protein
MLMRERQNLLFLQGHLPSVLAREILENSRAARKMIPRDKINA